MVKSAAMLVLGAAAMAAGLVLAAPASRASYSGDAPWCVMTFGDDVHWRCDYRSGEACVAAAAASRGHCNVNPYSSAPPAPAGPAKRGRRPPG